MLKPVDKKIFTIFNHSFYFSGPTQPEMGVEDSIMKTQAQAEDYDGSNVKDLSIDERVRA